MSEIARRMMMDYATVKTGFFSLICTNRSSHAKYAFPDDIDKFPDKPEEGETLFLEIACTNEDYSEYTNINSAPTFYALLAFNEDYQTNIGENRASVGYAKAKYADSTAMGEIYIDTGTEFTKVLPSVIRAGYIEGYTYNFRYWYVPFIAGYNDLVGGNANY